MQKLPMVTLARFIRGDDSVFMWDGDDVRWFRVMAVEHGCTVTVLNLKNTRKSFTLVLPNDELVNVKGRLPYEAKR